MAKMASEAVTSRGRILCSYLPKKKRKKKTWKYPHEISPWHPIYIPFIYPLYPHDIPFISSLYPHYIPIHDILFTSHYISVTSPFYIRYIPNIYPLTIDYFTTLIVDVPLYPHEIPINYWVNHHPPVIKHGLPTMVDYTGHQLILGYISYIMLYTSFYPMISPLDIPIEMPNCWWSHYIPMNSHELVAQPSCINQVIQGLPSVPAKRYLLGPPHAQIAATMDWGQEASVLEIY